jgi:Ion channel
MEYHRQLVFCDQYLVSTDIPQDGLLMLFMKSTTCGYGDLEPTTTGGQLFTILFAIYGVIILGVFIAIFGNFISETQLKTTRRLRKENETQIIDTLFHTERYHDAVPAAEESGLWSDHVSLLEDVWRVVRRQFPLIAIVAVLAIILGIREQWSFVNTLYFAIMAATTTGFGEYTPRTEVDKLYSIFFLPLAVAVFGEVLGRIATVFLQRKRRLSEVKFLHSALTLCDIRNMDTNDDGAVDREEFVLFMLQALQKVDHDTVQKLRDIFDSLDRNGNGLLQSDDLMEIRRSNYLPALERVQEQHAGLFELSEQPRSLARHRRHFTCG